MERLNDIHLGEILDEEFLNPLGITPYRLAKDIKVQKTRISEIIMGMRGISTDTAIRLGLYFNTTLQFRLNPQAMYDLEEAQTTGAKRSVYESIRVYVEQPAAKSLSGITSSASYLIEVAIIQNAPP